MNIYTYPRVQAGGREFAWGAPGFRDALCDRIGARVGRADTDFEAEQILVEYDDASVISVSLRPVAISDPEAAEYGWTLGRETKAWVIWRVEWKRE
jgi:hypothetical protein